MVCVLIARKLVDMEARKLRDRILRPSHFAVLVSNVSSMDHPLDMPGNSSYIQKSQGLVDFCTPYGDVL